MLAENKVFVMHEAEKQLSDSRGGSSDGKLTAEVIDYEMRLPHSTAELKLHRLTQDGLEHFVTKYGSTYKTLYLFDCRLVKDLSPLGDLPSVEAIRIEWCRNIDRLWDLSKNASLKILSIHDAKKLIADPMLLRTSLTLEEVRLWGGENKYELSSLSCFEGMKSLKRIDLNDIKLKERKFDVLYTLPNLEEFHFDAGMLTVEEIAWICAKFPDISGDCLRVYTENDVGTINDIRVCGYRKPALNLPEDQKRLDEYTAQFYSLVEKYRNE